MIRRRSAVVGTSALVASLASSIVASAAAPAVHSSTPAPRASAHTMSPFDAEVIALVKASPKLRIDTSVPSSEGFDPKTQPYVDIAGLPDGTAVGGYLESSQATRGALRDGHDVLIVPLESGGSGGVFTQIVFARVQHAPYAYAGYVSSAGHLGMQIKNGTMVATLPYYGPKDPNCCPSKIIVQTYAVVHGALRKLTDKTIPTPKPR